MWQVRKKEFEYEHNWFDLYAYTNLRYYQTPLIYASKAGNSELVEFLIKEGADINARDDNNWTVSA